MHSCRAHRWGALSLVAAATAATALAQAPRATGADGRVVSLGQPARWGWLAGFGTGVWLDRPSHDVMVRAVLGGYHSASNPITALTEIGGEVWVGARGAVTDGGARAMLRVPFFSAGVGADYSMRAGRFDLLVTARSPVRRGGLLTRGTMLRLDWYPLRGHSFLLGVTAPLGDPLAGRGRPVRDYVSVAPRPHPPEPHGSANPALREALDSLRASAEWIRRSVSPFIDQDGRNARVAEARTLRSLSELASHLAARGADDEVRYFHARLEQAFTIASGDDGGALAHAARMIVLDEVLLPYDRLLGRKKRGDTLRGLIGTARGRFGRWVAATSAVSADRVEEVLFVFQEYAELLEVQRRRAAHDWDDARLAWLPLQFALLPEDHDEEAELHALVERATGVSFAEHNRLAYVANLQFHWELLRMIRETRSYHVLWVHDFPALTPDGRLDWAAFAQVVDGYLATLADRVEAYDTTGRLPAFFIFLDEHYYEKRGSRILMDVLENPLGASAHLSGATADERARLGAALDRLRAAVRHSRVLQAEAREYGDAWLRNRIKVHVNITNRADASFWSGGLVSSVFGYPDNVMRDHRKIAFRDVDEADPFAGVAIFTGMGVGRQYLGPGWDDRSLIAEGPMLLQLRAAARDLLLSQGLDASDLPWVLRDTGAAAPASPAAESGERGTARAMILVNGTGYLPKPLNVAKAVLYSLMPAGSVYKIPDSLWNSSFYGALLVGACLRGSRVLVMAPGIENAPSAAFPQMARAHELFTRLLIVRRVLGGAMEAAGGDLRTGLYALPPDRGGFASRAARWAEQIAATPFLRVLLPFAAGLVPQVAAAGARSAEADTAQGRSAAQPDRPRLHLKVQFMATREFWDAITASAEWPALMDVYLRYREATYTPASAYADARVLRDSLGRIAERVLATASLSSRAASFAMVGSQNQDYRGMFMDGEVGVLFTGAETLVPLIDLVFMEGTVTWVDDQAALDALLPPVGELRRRIARVTKDGV